MAKTSKKYTESSTKQVRDDYESYGYNVSNAKRYNKRNKHERKFKDNEYFEDWVEVCATSWSVHYIIQNHPDHVVYTWLGFFYDWTIHTHICGVYFWCQVLD
jgi:hypothetical protein